MTAAVALALVLLAGLARADEPPRSPACRTALHSLAEAEDAIVAARSASSATGADAQRQRAITARLQPLRKRVADACLGGLTTSPPPSQRTVVVPELPTRPLVTAPAPRVGQSTPLPAAVPPPRVETPVTLGPCNAATCVASDGSTLTRVGPNLVGPRGACRVEGVFVRCP